MKKNKVSSKDHSGKEESDNQGIFVINKDPEMI